MAMGKNARRYRGFDSRLTVLISLLFLWSPMFLYGQMDTISLHKNEIDTIYIKEYSSPHSPPLEKRIIVAKNNQEALNGCYRIFTDSISCYIVKYIEGKEDYRGLTSIKYYKNGFLISIDVKGTSVIGAFFLSVPNYISEHGIWMTGYLKDHNGIILQNVFIFQIQKEDRILWEIFREDSMPETICFYKSFFK